MVPTAGWAEASIKQIAKPVRAETGAIVSVCKEHTQEEGPVLIEAFDPSTYV